ncbi:hypothetical protein H1Q78_16445 [Cellulosimicrobium cellulans]|uniref:hypothetical protein n=1 Tax=Cellulosimicrobium cellulans TaxID=1710 RepID=UPI001EDA6A04|nr:hypothetical protein [Cellulosimicrobium cellulans]UKJ63245.1 hypothetical protein H1Q78_16445 [Cellulosimicrobium cellulans]
MSHGPEAPSAEVVRPRRAPIWRIALGVLVAVLGLLAIVVPARIAIALGRDYRSGLCDGDDIFGNTCGVTDVMAFGVVAVLVMIPLSLGVVIAWPRRVALWLTATALVALGVFGVLMLG